MPGAPPKGKKPHYDELLAWLGATINTTTGLLVPQPTYDKGGTRYDAAAFTGMHNDGTPIDGTDLDNFLAEAQADPAGIAHFGRGAWEFPDTETAAAFVRQMLISRDGVVIEGEGKQNTILRSSATGGTARFLAVLGHLKGGSFATWDAREVYDATRYLISGPLTKNARFVPFNTPAEASNFSEGAVCFIATGQTVPHTADHQPNAELNIVRAIDTGGGGGVYVEYPLLDDYAQEAYNAGTTGISSVGGASGNNAPFYIANVTDRVLRGFTMRNLTLDLPDGLQAFSLWQVMDAVFENVHFRFSGNGLGSANSRFATFRNCTFEHIPASAPATQWYHIAPSTGCTDWLIDRAIAWSRTAAFYHFQEGVKNSRLINSSNYAHNLSNVNWNLLRVGARSRDLFIGGNDFRANVATSANLGLIDDLCDDGGTLGRNRWRSNSGAGIAALRVDAGGWHIEPQDTVLPVGLRAPQRSKSVISTPVQRSSYVRFNRKEVDLGTMPIYGAFEDGWVYVSTPFDAGATITIGYPGNTAVYGTIAAADLTTVGKKAITTFGAKYGADEESAERAMKAYVTGSPTAGEAKVTIQTAVGARRT